MSFAALTQALNLPEHITGPARMVAVALADHMSPNPALNDAICCWPSIATIAKKAGVSESTARRAIKLLTDEGAITVEHRRDQATNRTNLYRWHPWLMGDWDDAPMRKREEEARGYSYSYHKEAREQATTPEPTPTPEVPAKPAEKPADGFTEWWPHYPKKVKKLDAEKAYRAALKRGVTPKELLDGLQRQKAAWKAKGTEPQYIPYPATWLRAGSWEDELDTPAPSTDSPAPAINPNTGKPVTRDDFGYACIAAGIDPNLYINYWKPYMGLPTDTTWPEWAAKIDRFCGRA